MALPEIKLDFGDSFENALARRASADWYGQRARSEAAEDQRKAESQQYVEPAMRGDATAMAKLAFGNPQAAAAMATNFARMDTAQRAQTKERAEFAASSANAVLQADPADRAAIFEQQRAEGQRRGYDMSHLPPAYHPGLDPMLRSTRLQGLQFKDWYTQDQQNERNRYNQDQQNQRHDRPSGGGGQVIDMDGGGTSGQPQGDAVPYGPGGAMPAGNQGRAGNAIAGMESGGQPGGGYRAVGPVADSKGSRAYGKYQVMDFNVGPWTAEILGRQMTPQEFVASPEAQEAVFAGKFGQYVQKYGSQQAAARAWFAGEGGMNNPGARDVNGMTVARYEQGFNRGLGGDGGGAAGGAAVPPAGIVPGGIAQVPPDQIPPPGPSPVQPPTDYGPGYGQDIGTWDPARGTGEPWRPRGGIGDGSGTPVPPQGGDPVQPQGQPGATSKFLYVDPSTLGYKPLALLKNGVKTALKDGDHFVYYDPTTGNAQTGQRYLYNPKMDPQVEGRLAEAKRKAEGTGMFPGTSPEATALNELVATGQLTRKQAALFAAGMVTPKKPPSEAFRKLETEVGSVYRAIDRFNEVVTESGGGTFKAFVNDPRSAEAQKLNSAHKALETALRSEAFINTGVLQPAEAKMLQETLLAPTSFRGWMATPEAYRAMLDEIRRFVSNKMEAARESHGVEAPAPKNSTAQPSGPADGATATNPSTGEKLILRNGNWEPLK